MLVYFANDHLFDALFLIDESELAALVRESAYYQLMKRLNLVSIYFLQAFGSWNTREYLFMAPRDLSVIIRQGFIGLGLLLPHLDMAQWLKLWLVTLQPLFPWSLVYDVYANNALSVEYAQYIRRGLWYCALLNANVELTTYDTAMGYNTLVWVLSSVSSCAGLSIDAPIVRLSNTFHFL